MRCSERGTCGPLALNFPFSPRDLGSPAASGALSDLYSSTMKGGRAKDLSQEAKLPPYWRRWLWGAFSATGWFYGITPPALLLTLFGPAVGSFLLAYLTAGPKGLSGATESTQWLAYGFAGTVLV